MQLKCVLLHSQAIYTNPGFCVNNFFMFGVCFFRGLVAFFCLICWLCSGFFKTVISLYASSSTSGSFLPQLWSTFTPSLECYVKSIKVTHCSPNYQCTSWTVKTKCSLHHFEVHLSSIQKIQSSHSSPCSILPFFAPDSCCFGWQSITAWVKIFTSVISDD